MYMVGKGAAETGGTSTRSKMVRKTLGSETNNTYQYDYGYIALWSSIGDELRHKKRKGAVSRSIARQSFCFGDQMNI